MLLLLLMLLSACSQKEYEEAMKNGEEAVSDEDFHRALTYFQKAKMEKQDDDQALRYIVGVEKMIKAIDLYEEGDLDAASTYLEDITSDQELELLQPKAEEYRVEITSLYKEIEKVHQEIKEIEMLINKDDYEQAHKMVLQLKDAPSSHPALHKEEERVEDLDQKISSLIKTEKELDQIVLDVKELEKSGEYEEALKMITVFKESSLEHEQLKTKFSQLIAQEDAIQAQIEQKQEQQKAEKKKQEEKKANALKEKKQSLINEVQGYWDNLDEAYNYCTFTAQYYICVTEASDVFDFADITRWDANLDTNVVSMHLADGYEAKLKVDNGTLTLGTGTYVKISKEKLAKQLQFTEVDELFNIDMYRSFSDSYDPSGE